VDYIDKATHALGSQTVVPVALTSGPILPQSERRTGLYIVNVGANPVTISLANPAVAAQGIRLAPQGTSGLNAISLDRISLGRILDGPMYAIAETGASSLVIWESQEA
jgi:hypothetical protein